MYVITLLQHTMQRDCPVMRLDTVDIWQHYLWWQWTGNGRRGCGWDDVEFISEWLSLEVWPLISRHHTTTTHTMHCLSALPVTAHAVSWTARDIDPNVALPYKLLERYMKIPDSVRLIILEKKQSGIIMTNRANWFGKGVGAKTIP